MMDRKFFTKIFVSIAIVSFIGVFSTAFMYQRYFKDVLTRNEIYRVQRSIDQTSLNLDNQLYRIVNNVHYFFEYSGNGNRLMSLDTGRSAEAAQDREWANNALGAFRLQYSSELESAFFLLRDRTDGDKETLYFDSELDPVPEMDYRAQSWYRNFISGKSAFWSEPTNELLFFQDRSLTTVYLTLSRYDAEGRDGILVVRLNGKMFSDAFRLLATSDLNLELLNASGSVVYSTLAGSSGGHANDILMHSDLTQSGFQVQAHIRKSFIVEAVRKVRILQPFILVFIVIMTLLISIVLSLSLVRPVKTLLRLMKKAELGDLDVRFNGKYADEVGVLGNGFNRMLEHMTESIDKAHDAEMKKLNAEMRQKDATLLAMQNQINPHFLYNTLEVINCQAILHEVPSVSRMSQALADFFRYSIEGPKAEVLLAVEAAHVRTYLDIQHERYPDIEIDMDLEGFGEYPIIKLTLQPIVENAFKYAFAGERDYYLRIYAEVVSEERYAVYVEDNGEGMDEEDLNRLNGLLAEGDGWTRSDGRDGADGIGLINVQNRIRLHYGAEYGLSLSESMSGGILATISLPKGGAGRENSNRR